jgi:hypothetical protein
MLKKSITFEDYSEPPVEVTRDFYFNFTKLEVIEMLEVDDLEGTLARLQSTDNGPEAYELFKKIILSAYGERNEHGGFDKEDANGRPLSKKFESLPACGELIIGFLQDPMSGAGFIEACLPAKLVKEAKAAQAANPSKAQVAQLVQDAAERQANPETAIAPGTPPVGEEAHLEELRSVTERKFEDYTETELLDMSDDEFAKIVPVSSPKDMTQAQLMVAFKRKSAK